MIAVGAYVAQDLRDPYGVTRQLLRGAALRLGSSRQEALRRLGDAYLHRDPPTPEEVTGRQPAQQLLQPPGEPDQGASTPRSPSTPGAPAVTV